MVYKPTNTTGGPHPAWLLVFVGEILIFHCEVPWATSPLKAKNRRRRAPAASKPGWFVPSQRGSLMAASISWTARSGSFNVAVGGWDVLWLVVWNIYFFHILGIIIPTVYILFFRGVETTNQMRCSDFGGYKHHLMVALQQAFRWLRVW